MLTVTRAYNQRGWSANDHRLDDDRLTDMVGQSYKTLAGLKKAAQRRAESYPTVEYRDAAGVEWRYDGSPQGIPGRNVPVLTRLTSGAGR